MENVPQTEIIYYLNDESTPYVVKVAIAPHELTLRDVKFALGYPNYRFFFKTTHGEFGFVKTEVKNDGDSIPYADGRVVSWVKQMFPIPYRIRPSSEGDSVPAKKIKLNTVGSPCFTDIRCSQAFVDKTLLIEILFNRPEKVFLITTPPRFGKSVNLSMVRYFVEIPNGISHHNSAIELFTGTKIFEKSEVVLEHFGKYAVIHLNLAGMPQDFTSTFFLIYQKVVAEFLRHSYLKQSTKLNDEDKKLYSEYEETPTTWDDVMQARLETSLFVLTTLLKKHTGQDTIILVDEFDALVTNAMFSVKSEEELTRIIKLRDTVLGNVLKNFTGPPTFKLAILTGVADVICTVASPLRSLSRFRFLQDPSLLQFYGILQAEFDVLTADVEQDMKRKMIEWYNGYKCNGTRLYNTWSLVKSFTKKSIENFWIEETHIITKFRKLLADNQFSTVIKKLIVGESVSCDVPLTTVLHGDDLIKLSSSLESVELIQIDIILLFLFQNGYLTKADDSSNLHIPNEEVREAMKTLCYSYFQDCNISLTSLHEASKNFPSVFKCMDDNFNTSVFCEKFEDVCKDFKARFPFNHQVIHSLMFMIILRSNIRWTVVGFECPVQENYVGSPRCDIILFVQNILLIIELKYKDSVENALEQISIRNYFNIVKNTKVLKSEEVDGIEYHLYMGVAVGEDRKVTMAIQIRNPAKNILKTV